MKALAAMRGPLSFTAVEFSKCQHQTVVDLVDRVGMENPGALANQVVQAVQDPSFRVDAMTIDHEVRVDRMIVQLDLVATMNVLVSVVMMIAQLVRAGMTVDPVDPDAMTTDRGSAATMIDRVDHAVMTTVGHVVMTTVGHVVEIAAHLVHVQLPSRRPMKSAIGVVDEG